MTRTAEKRYWECTSKLIGLIFLGSLVVLELLLKRAERRQNSAGKATEESAGTAGIAQLGQAVEGYGRGTSPGPVPERSAVRKDEFIRK